MNEDEIKKQERLTKLQTRHSRLIQERIPLQEEYKKKSKELDVARRALNKKCAEIKEVGQNIFHLKHSGETPHVTDHAIVRYLERVEGMDIWEMRAKVANDKNAVRTGNVIVTVNQEFEDEA